MSDRPRIGISACFFHADPHPGNIFIQPLAEPDENGLTWRMTFIDFGMMGEVPTSLGAALRTTVIAAASRDGAGMVDGMRQIGVPNSGAVDLLEPYRFGWE